jgi:hypothetical protein
MVMKWQDRILWSPLTSGSCGQVRGEPELRRQLKQRWRDRATLKADWMGG